MQHIKTNATIKEKTRIFLITTPTQKSPPAKRAGGHITDYIRNRRPIRLIPKPQIGIAKIMIIKAGLVVTMLRTSAIQVMHSEKKAEQELKKVSIATSSIIKLLSKKII